VPGPSELLINSDKQIHLPIIDAPIGAVSFADTSKKYPTPLSYTPQNVPKRLFCPTSPPQIHPSHSLFFDKNKIY
jgi:hypothetical protein